MGIIFFFFYLLIVITIIVNVLKVVKAAKGNSNMFGNIQNMVNERYNRIIQNDVYGKKKAKVEKEVDLDEFMKSNTNPIKERSKKRSKI